MKRIIPVLLATALGFVAAMLWMSRQQSASHTDQPETQPAVPETPRAHAGGGLEKTRVRHSPPPTDTAPTEAELAQKKRGPQDLLNELITIQVTPGPGQARAQYRILALLDQLAQAGPAALPPIRQFLTSNQDIAYNSQGNRGGNGARNASLPPSLRFGLFDVVRQIGGTDAEQVLSESVTSTGRGAELAYLTQLLEELSPGKYRDAALAAARNLLASGKVTDPADRDNLYDVLRQLKDTAYVSTAQAQLVQADGKVDRSALRFVQQSLGEQSVALAAQLYQDKRVVDAASKEALGRVALTYVGANDQATELFHTAVLDTALKPDHRRELVEDLNQDGLSNKKDPSPADLEIIAKRYALTQAYLQQDYVQNDKVLNAAFREADKDLANLLQRAGVNPATAPTKRVQ